MYDRSTIIADLTVAEFQEVVRDSIQGVMQHPQTRYITSLAELAIFLRAPYVSVLDAFNEGCFEGAVAKTVDGVMYFDPLHVRRLWVEYRVAKMEKEG